MKWIFLPREVNIVADYLAGIATKFALGRLKSRRAVAGQVSLRIQPPLEQLLKVGARIRSFSRHTDSPTFIFGEVADCSRELVERYLSLFPAHKPNMLSYVAKGGQFDGASKKFPLKAGSSLCCSLGTAARDKTIDLSAIPLALMMIKGVYMQCRAEPSCSLRSYACWCSAKGTTRLT